ncbi:MAG TPA: hypothetical protein GXX19_07700 [Syntrophomonadaceae bacterium]|nr:hypothetical protein [Syntrophomonadaceae bacterium]
MQLSEEWLDFLNNLDKKGPVALHAFPEHFKNRSKAEKLLGEIIRQGLVDLDEYMTKLVITKKGRALVNNRSE